MHSTGLDAELSELSGLSELWVATDVDEASLGDAVWVADLFDSVG